MSWGAILSAAIGAYASYDAANEQKKLAKEARKGTTTTRTPYMNDAIQSIVPYLMKEQQGTYERRMGQYGAKAGDFSPFASLLAGVPQGYTGVSGPGGAPQVNPRFAGPGSAFDPQARDAPSGPGGMGRVEPQGPIRATIPDEGGQMPPQQEIVPQIAPQGVQQAQFDPALLGHGQTRYWEGLV